MEKRFLKLNYGSANKIIPCPNNYNDFILTISSSFPKLKDITQTFTCNYQDPEGDLIIITNQTDYDQALKLMKEVNIKTLKITINKAKSENAVESSKDFEIINSMLQSKMPQEIQPEEKKNNFGKNNEEGTVEYEKRKAKIEIKREIKNKFCPLMKLMFNELYTQAEKEIEKRFTEGKITNLHFGTICNGCKMSPIEGIRYKCSICNNFDYCEKCEEIHALEHGHAFIKLNTPESIIMIKNSQSKKNNSSKGKNYNCLNSDHHFIPNTLFPFGNKKEEIKPDQTTSNAKDYYNKFLNFCNSINYPIPFTKNKVELSSIQLNKNLIFETKNNKTEFTTILHISNNGFIDWPKPCYLKCLQDQSDISGDTIKITKLVKIGEKISVEVKINLRGITKQGKYYSKWQMESDKRKLFGQVFNIEVNCCFDSQVKIKQEYVQVYKKEIPVVKENKENCIDGKKKKDKNRIVKNKEGVDYQKLIKEMRNEYDIILGKYKDNAILNALILTKGNKENAFKNLRNKMRNICFFVKK